MAKWNLFECYVEKTVFERGFGQGGQTMQDVVYFIALFAFGTNKLILLILKGILTESTEVDGLFLQLIFQVCSISAVYLRFILVYFAILKKILETS